MTVLRPRAIAVALFAFLFTVNIHSAFATHFRYGTMFWEKNLSAGTATTDTYTVTADVSMRWSFPYGTSSTNFCLSAPGWVPSGSTTLGQGSCAPLGTVVPLGSIVFNKAVVVNGSSTTAVTFNATIISVSPATDTMFARMTFTVVVTKATNPVLVSWQNNARISTLLEGNADQNYRLETILDHTKGTKSPRSVSLPTLNVTTGVVNEVFIPTVAFDNFSNKLSFATTAQSGLVRPVPGTSTATTADDMTIDLTTPTLVRWTPPISGLYAVQFRITSYDNLGVQKATVPLDLIFHAKPAVPTDPVVSLTTPLTTVIFPIGVVSSFTITSQMTPPTVGFAGVLNNSPLPNGASLVSPACAGLQPCVRTIFWTPNLQSTSSVVCFQAQYSSGATTVQSAGMLCVNMLLGALQTATTAFAATGVAGGPVTLGARVLRTVDGAPVIQRNVTFSWADTGEVLGTGVTDNTGLARISPIIVEPIPQGRAYVATFGAVANEFLQSSATHNVTVVAGASALPTAPALNPLPTVGFPVTATVHLIRQLTPSDGGINGVMQPVNVTVIDPGGSFTIGHGTTDMSGNAIVSVPVMPPAAGAGWSAFSRFEGTTSLAGNTQSATVGFTVFQRIALSLSAPQQIVPGIPFPVTGTLLKSPQGQPIANRVVTLSAPGAASVQAATSLSGQFTATMVFPSGTALGGVTISGSTPINNGSPLFEVDSEGFASAEMASTAATLGIGVPTEVIVSPVTAISGQAYALTATVRQTATGAAVANAPVDFSIAGGAALGTGTTNASGVATITFTPGVAMSGAYRATFNGDGSLLASNAQAALIINQAATSLAPLTMANVEFVGNSLSVSTALSRTDAPADAVPGAAVQFAMTAPSGAITTLNASTDGAGAASVTFPLSERGQHHVTATYAGSASLTSTSRSGDLGVFQKTRVIANAAQGVASDHASITAGLFTLPGNAPIPGATVSLNFQGVVASGDAVTNSAGVAAIVRTFAQPGTYQYTASFSDFANYFVNENGDPTPTMATSTVEITDVTTTLAPIQVSSTPLVGDDLVVTTVLNRITVPAGALANQPVTFTLTAPSGAVVTQAANTNGDGQVQATFPLSARGSYTIAADYAGNIALRPSSVSTPVNVYQKVRIVMAPIGGAVAGLPVIATAALVAIPQNTPIAGGQITFTTSVAGVGPTTMGVDGSGVASTALVFPLASTVSVTATHVHAAAEYFANSFGQLIGDTDATTNAAVPVTGAPSAFSPIVVAPSGLVGNSTTASTTLTRADNNAPVAARSVTFTFTSPGNAVSQVAGLTDAAGAVSVSFTPAERGIYSVTAGFAGDGAVFASTSSPAAITVYQRVALTLSAPAGSIAGQDITLTASLKTLPGNAGIAGQAVSFASNFSAPSTTNTDASGVATVTIVAASAGTLNAQATFLNTAEFFVNDAGDLAASSASATSNITGAATSLSNVIVPGAALVDAPTTVTAVLMRTSAPAGPAAGETVHFTITDPTGSTILSGTTVTSAAGTASFNFAPGVRGVHTVSASFAATSALESAVSASSGTFSVYQRTQLVLSPAAGSATKNTAVSAVLTAEPGGAPLAGESVTFSFNGPGAPAAVTGTTDANGVVTVTVKFPTATTYTSAAEWSRGGDFYTNRDGNIPPTPTTAVGTVDVTNNAPTFTPPANITAEATGPTGAPVTFTASGADIEDGPLVADCQASSGLTFPLGATTVSCTVIDSAGATASGTFTITVQDTTAPVLTVPANIATDATSPSGATVSFTATAFDAVSLTVVPVCTPASGSLFAVGTTTINCTATDAVSNQSSGSLTVTVRSPQQMTANLQQAAAAAGLPQGDNNLDNLTAFLNGQGTTNAACNNLSSFIKKAEKLPASQSGPVIAAAMNLWASIPCSGTP